MESLAMYGSGEGNTVTHYYDKKGIKNPGKGKVKMACKSKKKKPGKK